MENGEWRMENGEWRMENGKLHIILHVSHITYHSITHHVSHILHPTHIDCCHLEQSRLYLASMIERVVNAIKRVPGIHSARVWLSDKRGLYLLVIFYAFLGLTFMVNTPLFESPDESGHLQVIHYMRLTWRLPPPRSPEQRAVTGEQVADLLTYHVPPLYYAPPLYHALGALLTAWTPMEDLPQRLIPSPSWAAGYAPGAGHGPWNKNIYVHLPGETVWESPTVRAMVVLRLLSLILGGVTIGCTYTMARQVWPQRPRLAWGAAAWVALNPQFIDVSSGVTNDPLLNAIFSLTLLGFVKQVTRGRKGARAQRRNIWGWLGMLVGVGMLTKQSALILLPLGGLAILLQACHEVSVTAFPKLVRCWFAKWREIVTKGALFGGCAWLVGGWWYVLNAVQYNDPLGVAPHMNSQVPLPQFDIHALWLTFRSYWAGFGWGTPAPGWIYVAGGSLVVLAMLGWVYALLPGGELGRAKAPKQAVLVIFGMGLLLNSIGLVRWAIPTGSPTGRLLFTTIAATGVLVAWGIGRVAHLRPVRWILALVIISFMGFDLWVPWARMRPVFASPYHAEGRPDTAEPLDADFDVGIRLIGYEALTRDLQPGDALKVVTYWQAKRAPEHTYTVWGQLGPHDATQRVADTDRWLGGTLYPSQVWRAGDVVQHTLQFQLPNWTPAPALYWVRMGLLDAQGARVALATEDNIVVLGPWRVRAADEPSAPAQPTDFYLGSTYENTEVRLAGVTYDSVLDETLHVTLTWKARAPLPTDYVAFVHLLDTAGKMVAQHDGPPARGAYPTSWWLPGDVILDQHTLSLSSGLDTQSWRLHVGLYDPVTLQRLPAYNAAGARLPDDVIPLEIW